MFHYDYYKTLTIANPYFDFKKKYNLCNLKLTFILESHARGI